MSARFFSEKQIKPFDLVIPELRYKSIKSLANAYSWPRRNIEMSAEMLSGCSVDTANTFPKLRPNS